MITGKKEIVKKYNQLLEEVRTKEFYTKIDLANRINCYKCKCGNITKTKDIDAGVTPFIFSCEKCGGMATSTFFEDVAPDKEPTYEWYRPSLEELFKTVKGESELNHILKGGLSFRKINTQK